MIYVAAGAITIFLAKIIDVKKIKLPLCKFFTLIIIFLPLIVISSIRFGIGTDFFNYEDIFSFIKNYNWGINEYNIEPGFALLNKLVLHFTNNFQWFIVITSIIYLLLVVLFLYFESDNLSYSIFLFLALTFYFSSFNTIREHLGISIAMLAIPFARKKKFIPFLLIVCAAGMIHYSCFVFLIVYLFNRVYITPKKSLVISIIILLASPLLMPLITKIVGLTPYAKYLNTGSSISIASILGIGFQLFIFLLASYYFQNEKKYSFYYSIQYISLIVCALGGVIPMFSRVKWIFFMPSLILIPMIFSNIKRQDEKSLIKISTSTLFIIYGFVIVFILRAYEAFPYESILK